MLYTDIKLILALPRIMTIPVSTSEQYINRRSMPVLKDGVYFGKNNNPRGIYKWLPLSKRDIQLLVEINEPERKKFKRISLIPRKLLCVFWNLGFFPMVEKPQQGLRTKAFLKLLSSGQYANPGNRFQGIWLRDIIQAEEYPESKRTPEKYIGRDQGGKLWPAAYLREVPGTIIK